MARRHFLDLEEFEPLSREKREELLSELKTEQHRQHAQRIVERTARINGVFNDKLHDPSISRQLDPDWRGSREWWQRMESRDLQLLVRKVHSEEMRQAERTGEQPQRDDRREIRVDLPERRFDPRMMGKLAGVEPLRDGELDRLYEGMVRNSDRREFMGMVKDYQTRSVEDRVFSRDIEPEALAVYEFSQEMERRKLARDLRDLHERVRIREDRARTRNRDDRNNQG